MPLFMIVEHFRNGEAAPVYRRFKERGRMAPDGLTYVSSWVDENLATCYQSWKLPIERFSISGCETGSTWLNLKFIQSLVLTRQRNA